MTASTPRKRTGGRSARVTRAVLNATLDVIDSHGIDFVTINAIAEAAGVHETSIYRRWGTRERLILDALLAYTEEETDVPNKGSLEKDLAAYAEMLAAHLKTSAGRALLRAFAARGDDQTIDEERQRMWRLRMDRLSEMLQRAFERGELKSIPDTSLVIEMLSGPMYARVLATHEPIDGKIPAQIAAIVASGLKHIYNMPKGKS